MPYNYDLSKLDPEQFQTLSADLIGQDIRCRFEQFGPGPDGGIDGRYAKGPDNIILQAKHLFKSGTSQLESKVKKERTNIDKIKPSRYILSTSVSMTPSLKNRLMDIIGPTSLSSGDIYGQEDIQGLLRKYKNIVEDYPELWGTNVKGFEEILIPKLLSKIVTETIRPEHQNDPLDQRITDATDLLKDSSPEIAISRLKKLLKDEGKNAKSRNRFRIKTNIGVSYYANRDKESTIQYFREAYDEYPDTAESLSIRAAAEFILENTEKAEEYAIRAMKMPEPEQRAITVFLASVSISTPWKELQQKIPEHFKNVPENLLLLAYHAKNNGQFEDCQRLIRDALCRDPDNWQIRYHAGSLLSEHVEPQEIRSFCLLQENDIPIMKEARQYLLEAWQILKEKNIGWIAVGEDLLANATMISVSLRDKEQAEEILDEAFNRFGETPSLLRAQAILQISKELKDEVFETILKIPQDKQEPGDKLILAQIMIHLGKAKDALICATDLYSKTQSKNNRNLYAGICIQAAARISNEKFFSVTSEILKLYPNDTLILAEYISNYPGNGIEQKYINRFVTVVEMEKELFALNKAAYAFKKIGRYSESADIFKKLCNPDMDTPQLNEALEMLIESGRNKEAKEIYDKISPIIKKTAHMRRLGASIFFNEGDFEASRDEFEYIFNTKEETLHDRIFWIDICEIIPDTASIHEYLRELTVDINGDPLLRMYLACKIDQHSTDYKKALEIGYRALYDGYDKEKVHGGYIVELFTKGNVKDNFDFNYTVVTQDTAVNVTCDYGESFTKIIVTSLNPRIDKGEIHINDPLAQKLLGKSVGETIEIESLMGPQIGIITEIKSKYLYALQLAKENFRQYFPESKILKFKNVNINNPKKNDSDFGM